LGSNDGFAPEAAVRFDHSLSADTIAAASLRGPHRNCYRVSDWPNALLPQTEPMTGMIFSVSDRHLHSAIDAFQ
jgi:hypothetical protein